MPDLHQGDPHATIDLDLVPLMAFHQAVPEAAVARLLPDVARNRSTHDSALPDVTVDGQGADPLPKRAARRPDAGHAIHVRAIRFRGAGLDPGLGQDLRAGAGVGADRCRSAHYDL